MNLYRIGITTINFSLYRRHWFIFMQPKFITEKRDYNLLSKIYY